MFNAINFTTTRNRYFRVCGWVFSRCLMNGKGRLDRPINGYRATLKIHRTNLSSDSAVGHQCSSPFTSAVVVKRKCSVFVQGKKEGRYLTSRETSQELSGGKANGTPRNADVVSPGLIALTGGPTIHSTTRPPSITKLCDFDSNLSIRVDQTTLWMGSKLGRKAKRHNTERRSQDDAKPAGIRFLLLWWNRG